MLKLSVSALPAFQIDQYVRYQRQAVQKSAQKGSEEFLEVHCGGCQDRVDLVSDGTLQPVAFQPVFALEMSDAWFDRGTAFHPSPSRLRCAPSLSLVNMHGDRTVIIVTSIAHINVRFVHLAICLSLFVRG